MSNEWIEPVVGFELSQEESIVTEQYQVEKLASQGLDASLFGDHVDPSFYIGIGISSRRVNTKVYIKAP